MQVLVVDDSETVRREISQALREAGFETAEARDGKVGLQLAQERKFALILLDVNMPVMNGLEMLEQLRLNWGTANVPVLMLTTEAEEYMIERARKAGAKGWLIKPVATSHIVSTAKALTKRPETSAPGA